MLMFINAISDTVFDAVFDMINAFIDYFDKPLIFIGATFRETEVCFSLTNNLRSLGVSHLPYDQCGIPLPMPRLSSWHVSYVDRNQLHSISIEKRRHFCCSLPITNFIQSL